MEIHEGTDPNVDELYVFRQMSDGSTWQMIYEFDEKEQLVSVTMPLVAEGGAEAFTDPFLAAMDYFREELGDCETRNQDALDLMLEDPDAFMESLFSEDNSIMLCWKDAFSYEGSELYLMFMGMNGNPSVFAVYYSPDYEK